MKPSAEDSCLVPCWVVCDVAPVLNGLFMGAEKGGIRGVLVFWVCYELGWGIGEKFSRPPPNQKYEIRFVLL